MMNKGSPFEKQEPIGKIGLLGITPSYKDGFTYIARIASKSAAEQAGLLVGDKIISANGIKLNDRDDRLRVWDLITNSPDQFIDVVTEREGTKKEFNIKLNSKDIYNQSKPFLAIRRYVFAGDQVSIANFVDSITHVGYSSPSDNWEGWEKLERINTLNIFEQDWLNYFSGMSNF